MNYQQYLKSKKWKRIRKRVLKRDGWKCRLCERRATQVHHRDYEKGTMEGGQDDRLYSVCGPCHELLTFDCVGERRPMKEMQQKTKLLGPPKSTPRKSSRKRKPKSMTLEEIRAGSLEYAFGERRKG